MKTVIVTGGSRGIGRAIAEKFAKENYNVILNYNKSEYAALEIAKQYKNVEIFKANVSNSKDVEAMINFAIEKYGQIDILINNAGITKTSLFTEITEKSWDKQIDINLKGVFNVTQETLRRYMIDKKDGTIINIASIDGISGASCEVA